MGMRYEAYRNPPHKLTVGERYSDADGSLWRVVDERHLVREGTSRETRVFYRAVDEAFGPLRNAELAQRSSWYDVDYSQDEVVMHIDGHEGFAVTPGGAVAFAHALLVAAEKARKNT